MPWELHRKHARPCVQVALLMLRGKAMGDKAGELFGIMHDILLSARLDDRERFLQMVLETKAGMEAGVVGSGHSVAAARLAAQRSTAGWANERMDGLSALFYIRDLAKRVESDWDAIKADLEEIRSLVLSTEVRAVHAVHSGLLGVADVVALRNRSGTGCVGGLSMGRR